MLLTLSWQAWGQVGATIVGTVTDNTGAVIPGAAITVANPGKGLRRELFANSVGEYTAPELPIGEYMIAATAQGFQRLVRSGITLTVGQVLRVDLQLGVGQVTQQVTVSGNVTNVQTETAAVSDVVTGSQIRNLELNGRNFVSLALLVPGASPDNSLNTQDVGVIGSTDISFNGSREQANNWEIDGGIFLDETSNDHAAVYPSLDSIAEFRISTSTYGAESGRHAGAVIQVSTKSGTRDFHGELFEFLRNDALDSNDWFVNRQIAPPGGNAPKTPLKRNEFGYNLGGPFYIPGHYNTSKSKTFFFWTESWRCFREGTVISGLVPSALQRQGNFSECDSASPNYNAVVAANCTVPLDPTTGQPFPNDQVPIDPNGKAPLEGLMPVANNGVVGYVGAPSLPTNWRQEQIRVDQNIGEKVRAFFRLTNDAWNSVAVPSLWTSSTYDAVATAMNTPGKSAVLSLTHSIRPNLLNEIVLGFESNGVKLNPVAGASSVAGINKLASWNAAELYPQNNNPLLPGIQICFSPGVCQTEDTSFAPFHNQIRTGTLADKFTYSHGRHTIKAGAFLEFLYASAPWGSQSSAGDSQGYMTFGTANAVSTRNALADMYLGRIQSLTQITGSHGDGVPLGYLLRVHGRQTDFELLCRTTGRGTGSSR